MVEAGAERKMDGALIATGALPPTSAGSDHSRMTHTVESPRTAPSPLNPPTRLLMGPGPSNPDPRVLTAMGASPVGHLDPYFVDLMDETMDALREVYRTANHHTLPISGTGSAGLEAIMLNLLEPGDSAVVCINGYFGHRLAELARRSGADVRTIEAQPGEVVDPAALDAMLKERAAKVVAFVHAETTTGALQPIHDIVAVARQCDALVVMDCVTSLGGVPIEIDAWGIDAAGSCTQKCIGAPPGLGPITVGPRAMEAVRARKANPAHGISTCRCYSSTGVRPARRRSGRSTIQRPSRTSMECTKRCG